MPWKETCAMEERVKFIKEYRSCHFSVAELCRRYGISRKTGYKWITRAEQGGRKALSDLSRAPHHHPHAISEEMVELILELRGEHPSWGPKKIMRILQQRHGDLKLPCISSIGAIISRNGLSVPRRRRRRCEPSSQPFAECSEPNQIWCADFKGWFKTGDGRRVDPLTITDAASRYIIRCQAMSSVSLESVQRLFEASFREYGLPLFIRTDNGRPFSSHGIGGLTRLSAWWISLGIIPERIEPGKPYQNGRHERMHLTLKQETAKPPARSLRAQQRSFDRFVYEFNHDRPHESLGQETPASVYEFSSRRYPDRLPTVEYPDSMVRRKIQSSGEFYWRGHKIFLTEALGGQEVGLEPIDDRYFEIYFATVPVGVFDSKRLMAMRRKKEMLTNHAPRSSK